MQIFPECVRTEVDAKSDCKSPFPPPPEGMEPHYGLEGRVRLVHSNKLNLQEPEALEKERRELQAYEYLCHVSEAKEWIESCIREKISPVSNLEFELSTGVTLAQIANNLGNRSRRIYYDVDRLQYRCSDNINVFLDFVRSIGLPEVFYFELTDLYERKNLPRVIYCIHALGCFMSKRGLVSPIKDMVGKLEFTEDEIYAAKVLIDASGGTIPQFGNMESVISKQICAGNRDAIDIPLLPCKTFPEEDTCEEEKKGYPVEEIIRSEATKVIQRSYKRYIERKDESSEKRVRAAIVIQRLYRERVDAINKMRNRAASKIQATVRSRQLRKVFLERLDYLNRQSNSVKKIEEFWHTQKINKFYGGLQDSPGPAIKNIRSICHIWESMISSTGEREVEMWRQRVIRLIRENSKLESDVNDLDTKIYLLIRNRVTLEEILHSTKKKSQKDKSSTVSLSSAGTNGQPSLGIMSSKMLQSQYGALFHILQVQPRYLSRLIVACHKMENAALSKRMEQIISALFGYAQNPREEYLLLELIKELVKLEVSSYQSIEMLWRSNPFFVRCILLYSRMAQNTRYIRYLFGPLVKKIVDEPGLDLEVDVVGIYRSLIRDEEISTGDKSKRSYDVTFKNIREDKEVQSVQNRNIERLKEATNMFLDAMMSSVKSVPSGIKYIISLVREHLMKKFPKDLDVVTKFMGDLVYYRYLNPAIVAPESFGVLDGDVSLPQRKNLAEIAKILHHISVCKLFASVEEGLYPFNPFIKESYAKFLVFFEGISKASSLDDYDDSEFYMDIDGINQAHTCFIDEDDIYKIHSLLLEHEDEVITSKGSTPIVQILRKLPPPPVERADSQKREVQLNLISVFPVIEGERTLYVKRLLSKAKRLAMIVIRIQSADNLLDLLESPAQEKHERRFLKFLKKNCQHLLKKAEDAQQPHADPSVQSQAEGDNDLCTCIDNEPPTVAMHDQMRTSSLNLSFQNRPDSFLNALNSESCAALFVVGANGVITFTEFKRRVLEIMSRLEDEGEITKEDNYQDILNHISKDMITRRRQLKRREKELETLKKTLDILQRKQSFLIEQKNCYQDYINSCLTNRLGKTKPRRFSVFSKNSNSVKSAQNQNSSSGTSLFGSFNYTATELHKRGILKRIEYIPPKNYGQITFTISSNQAGVFNVVGTFFGVKMPETVQLHLDDLLSRQYNKEDTMCIIEKVVVNLNLLIHFLNKRFYT